MDSDFKKMSRDQQGGDFIPHYATNPMSIIHPLSLKGYMISMGSVAWEGRDKIQTRQPLLIF